MYRQPHSPLPSLTLDAVVCAGLQSHSLEAGQVESRGVSQHCSRACRGRHRRSWQTPGQPRRKLGAIQFGRSRRCLTVLHQAYLNTLILCFPSPLVGQFSNGESGRMFVQHSPTLIPVFGKVAIHGSCVSSWSHQDLLCAGQPWSIVVMGNLHGLDKLNSRCECVDGIIIP